VEARRGLQEEKEENEEEIESHRRFQRYK